MRSHIALVVLVGCATAIAAGQGSQGPSSSFPRGNSQQSWQNAGYKAALAKCKNPPQPFAIPATWGTPSARNKIIAIPLITEGYKGRAK
jgi:hypothetical protein